ncbi:hypothetical protein [Carboxylicivirga sp. M1479]|uniref:hypothetical protein n=1 Tax=Carboxylicivirga sp. M1479 TaxID=2594476 RepID=UPI0011789393|nr:hypothetical protein [Carboxylicivirga sp. M1479]TRX63172.1 hypothetical protein FNN09_18945 [Carboxylicivirga sp. M1479]
MSYTNNKFTKVVSQYSDIQLQDIIDNREDYVDEMILAAINELDKRNANKTEIEEIKQSVELRVESNELYEQERKEQSDNRFTIPINLPKEIRTAAYLLYLSTAIGIVAMIFLSVKYSVGINIGELGITVPTFTIMLFVAYMIHAGYKWARNLFVGMFIIGMIIQLASISHMPISPLNMSQIVLQIMAIYFLFTADVRKWYKEHEREFKTTTNGI